MGLNCSIPAYLSNFSVQDDKRTVAKLKVFYVGETADGRVFDKEFSEKLVASLPYTPVVAYYSDLKDDFIGHNMKQYIYGIVTPEAKNGFETDENGTEWFTTEVMLYTDRIDNIGEIAKKIVGCAQSLEMDPSSVEYEVFKEDKHTKIRFKNARLCGLSVLGSEQKPAFTGSEFFTENEDLRERFENFFSFLTNKDRGATMDKEIFAQYVNFVTLSYNEKQCMVSNYYAEQMGDSSIFVINRQMDDASVVFEVIDENWNSKYVMYDYVIDEQGVSLTNERSCFMRFLSIEQLEKLERCQSEDFASQPKEEEEPKDEKNETEEDSDSNEDKEEDFANEEEEEEEKSEEEPKDGDEEDFSSKVDVEEKELDNNTESTFTAEEGDANEQEQEDLQEEGKENFTTSAPELSNSEREELEAYRLKERVSLVDSYKDDFDADTLSSFKEMAKTINYDELEAKLAIKFREISKTNIKNEAPVFSLNNVISNTVSNTPKSYADLVRATLNK